MRVEYLYYFLVVSETKSLNKAANKLFISQQQLSRIVSSLENEFQTQLLNRTSGGVSLTKDGEEFTKYAIDIVNKAREMHAYFYLNHQPAHKRNSHCTKRQLQFSPALLFFAFPH